MLPEWLLQVGESTPAPTHGAPTVWREACLESRPVLLASWLAEQSQPVVVLTPSLARAEQWLAVLMRLGLPEDRLLRLPSSLTPPAGADRRGAGDATRTPMRPARAASGRGSVHPCADCRRAATHNAAPRCLKTELVRLRLPDAEPPDTHEWLCQIAPDALLRRLAEDGYEYQEPVRLPGRFARRGGIVDVFPMGAELPVRIEFWGDEIASLRLFEPATQRSVKQVKYAMLLPAREVPMGTPEVAERVRAEWEARIARQPAALQPTLRQNLEDDLRPLMQGAPFDQVGVVPAVAAARACMPAGLPARKRLAGAGRAADAEHRLRPRRRGAGAVPDLTRRARRHPASAARRIHRVVRAGDAPSRKLVAGRSDCWRGASRSPSRRSTNWARARCARQRARSPTCGSASTAGSRRATAS
jgi:hypothetical protein